MREHSRNLERANDTAARSFGWLLMGDVITVERDDAACGCQKLREQVAMLAVAGAEKILLREIDAKIHADMLTQLKAQL